MNDTNTNERTVEPEIISTVNRYSGKINGIIEKEAAHRNGIWHANIHVWITDNNGQVLFQQRAWNKKRFPGTWSASVTGHIRPGEDGTREIYEELGMVTTLDTLELIGILTVEQTLPDMCNRERPRVYLWRSGLPLETFSFTDGEVIALAAIDTADLEDFVAGQTITTQVLRGGTVREETLNGKNLVPLSQEYWNTVRAALRRKPTTA